ncbi:competence protein CoiA family protein [Streptomyces adustus]|uniref:competence protein CoiA family protein n=1 Tax=Streptomyces adustus TaxID=1609272 RepID=UPI0013916009
MIHSMRPFEEEDTRKVQTAVAGRPGSDEPVFLPFDHGEFPEFLARYPNLDFFCGSLLGGCGKKLSAKRYTSKKCHFAHHPPVQCRRTSNSESSADHLYVGQALKQWLQQQGQRDVSVSYDLFGADSGGCVNVSFDGGRRAVRVQLDRMEWKSWLARREKLNQATRGRADWIYGPDSMLAHNEVDTAHYALRVQCRTVGATREVQIGTQLPGHTIEWTTLNHCRLTDSNILTPHLEETDEGIRVRRSDTAAKAPAPAPPTLVSQPAPVVFQLASGTVAFTAAVAVAGTQGPRRLYDALVQSTGSAPTPGRISLPAEAAVPDHDQLWVLLGPATLRLPLTGDSRMSDSHVIIAAQSIARLEGNAHKPWQGLRPPNAPAPTATASPSKAVPENTHTPQAPTPTPTPLDVDHTHAVTVIRDALQTAARHRSPVGWEALAELLGTPVTAISHDQRVRLLAAVDSPHGKDAPLLSSLVELAESPDEPPPFFRDVLKRLGWEGDLSGNALAQIRTREQQRAYQALGSAQPSSGAPTPAQAPAPSPPTPHVAGPDATAPQSGAEQEAQAALEALLDQSLEARDAGDWGAVRETARFLSMLRDNPNVAQAVRTAAAAEYDLLTAWSGGSPTVSGYRLASLLKRLKDEGENLPLAALRTLVDDAEAEADKLDRYLTTDELDELGRWSDELARRSGRLPLDALQQLGGEVRSVLESYARAGAVVPWTELSTKVDAGILDLHPDDQVELLVQADSDTTPDAPLLSALVTDDNFQVHPFYARILDHLDRPPTTEAELPTQWRRDVLRLHALWSERHQPNEAPQARPLS